MQSYAKHLTNHSSIAVDDSLHIYI